MPSDCFKGSYTKFNLTNSFIDPGPLIQEDETFSASDCIKVGDLIPNVPALANFYYNLRCDPEDCNGSPLEIRVYIDDDCTQDITSTAAQMAGAFVLVTEGMHCGDCDGKSCDQTQAFVPSTTDPTKDGTGKGFSGLVFAGIFTVITIVVGMM